MFTEKQSMLYHAPALLNRPDIPWVVTVEGDSIVARWKWMDAAFFAPNEVNNEIREFTFIVTLSKFPGEKQLYLSAIAWVPQNLRIPFMYCQTVKLSKAVRTLR